MCVCDLDQYAIRCANFELFNDNSKKSFLFLNNSYTVGFFPAKDFAVGKATFTHQFFLKLVFFY